MIDEGTFGRSPAAIVLAKMVNESDDKNLAKRIKRRCDKFEVDMRVVGHMVGPSYYSKEINAERNRRLLQAVYQYYKNEIENSTLPEKIRTYLLNFLACKHREIGRDMKRLVSYLEYRTKLEKEKEMNNEV
jgi:hypothetical protein